MHNAQEFVVLFKCVKYCKILKKLFFQTMYTHTHIYPNTYEFKYWAVYNFKEP